MSISLVIPTLNEEENLRALLPKVASVVDEVIVVDGHSTDKTVEVAKLFPIKVIECDGEKGVALRVGMSAAQGEIVLTMDGDCSQLPSEIPAFVEKIKTGYDIVIGSRFLLGGGSEEVTPFRKLGIVIFRSLINSVWKTNYTDVNYGFRAFKKECIEELNLRSSGFDIDVEVVIRAAKKKMKICEIPCFEKSRPSGLAKLRVFRDGFVLLRGIIVELFRD